MTKPVVTTFLLEIKTLLLHSIKNIRKSIDYFHSYIFSGNFLVHFFSEFNFLWSKRNSNDSFFAFILSISFAVFWPKYLLHLCFVCYSYGFFQRFLPFSRGFFTCPKSTISGTLIIVASETGIVLPCLLYCF